MMRVDPNDETVILSVPYGTAWVEYCTDCSVCGNDDANCLAVDSSEGVYSALYFCGPCLRQLLRYLDRAIL
jgi:hypothetical protein